MAQPISGFRIVVNSCQASSRICRGFRGKGIKGIQGGGQVRVKRDVVLGGVVVRWPKPSYQTKPQWQKLS